MDALPPNDPNGNNNNARLSLKEQPYDGTTRRRGGRGAGSQGGQQQDGQQQETMDVFGDLNEAPAVVVMFLVGVAAWFLRERCVC